MKSKMMPKLSLAAISMLIASTMIGTAANATEEIPGMSETRAFFTEYGVAENVQDDLIEKYLAGEEIDSHTGLNLVSTETIEFDNKSETVSRFADGSVRVTGLERPSDAPPETSPDVMSPMHVGSCTKSGSNYYNCEVYMWVGTISMSFRADYNTSGFDTILSVYSANHSGLGIFQNPSLSITRKKETSSLPATARYSVQRGISIKGIIEWQTPSWVQLNVRNNVATETHQVW